MKALALCGSPRRGGNTEFLLNTALDVLASNGCETELVTVPTTIKPCVACYACREKGRCIQKDEHFDAIYAKMLEADAIFVGSPVYFSSATPQLLALLDRAFFVARCGGENKFRRKVGAAIAVARRAGCNATFSQLNYFFLISEMIVAGSTYWNNGFGLAKGDVANDEEAIKVVQTLGENVAWLLERIGA
ncbi:MAG: flavodoxin family protein [Thermoguttaceae bacterium]